MASTNVKEKPLSRGDANAKMLSVLAGVGLPGSIVSTLLEMGGAKMSLDDGRFLRGPIIVHKNEWMQDIPKWMFDQVRSERTEIALGRLKMPVGPTEIACVMYPATMAAPLQHDVTELYLWASTNASARHYGKPVAEYWQKLGREPITDDEVIRPDGRLFHQYSGLAREIRHKVINCQIGRERAEKHQAEPATRERQLIQLDERVPIPPNRTLVPVQPPPQRPARRAVPQSSKDRQAPQQGLFSWLLKGIVGHGGD